MGIFDKEECPHCQGLASFEVLTSEYWQEQSATTTVPCKVCAGTGLVTRLQAATYRARGGPATITMRGFA